MRNTLAQDYENYLDELPDKKVQEIVESGLFVIDNLEKRIKEKHEWICDIESYLDDLIEFENYVQENHQQVYDEGWSHVENNRDEEEVDQND